MARGVKDLRWWQNAERRYVNEANISDQTGQALLAASRQGAGVSITYDGGSSPGSSRTISPKRIFRVRGYDSLYVEAHCHLRGENRTFRLDKITIHPAVPPQACTPPSVNLPKAAPPPSQTKPSWLDRLTIGILLLALLLWVISRLRF